MPRGRDIAAALKSFDRCPASAITGGILSGLIRSAFPNAAARLTQILK